MLSPPFLRANVIKAFSQNCRVSFFDFVHEAKTLKLFMNDGAQFSENLLIVPNLGKKPLNVQEIGFLKKETTTRYYRNVWSCRPKFHRYCRGYLMR